MTVVAIFIAVSLMAMPITIVGTNFSEAWDQREENLIIHQIERALIDKGLKAEDAIGLISIHDRNASGSLDFSEFVTMMRELGLTMPKTRLRRVFRHFDERNSGEASYASVCRHIFPTFDVESLTKVDYKRSMKRVSMEIDESFLAPARPNPPSAAASCREPTEASPSPGGQRGSSDGPSKPSAPTGTSGTATDFGGLLANQKAGARRGSDTLWNAVQRGAVLCGSGAEGGVAADPALLADLCDLLRNIDSRLSALETASGLKDRSGAPLHA